MWNLKFKVENIDSVYSPLTTKYDVVDYFYPLDKYRKNKKIFILGIHLLDGGKKEKDGFIRDLKNNKKIIKCEADENRIIVLIKEEEKFYEILYNPEIYFPTPVIIKGGKEFWDIAAWNRNLLTGVINEIEKWKNKLPCFELISLKKTKLGDIYFPKVMPEIPEKQKEAFGTARKNGYYKWPRKLNLIKLAKISKVSTQTFHENLRKAEAKLMPFFSEK